MANTKKKKRAGRKGKAEYWLKKEQLQTLRGWALQGATDAEIIEKMHISKTTFYRWKQEKKEFRDALNKGGDWANAAVASMLFKTAMDGNFAAMKYWLTCRDSKHWNESLVAQSEETTEVNIIDDI